MQRILLDTGAFVVFQRGDALDLLERLATLAPLVVVEEVYDELTGRVKAPKGPDGSARAEQAREFLDRLVTIESVMLDSPGERARAALRAGLSNPLKDLGEDTSIAWALFEPDVVLILNDEKAVGPALRELPGRVRMVHELLTELVSHDPHLVSAAAALSLAANAAMTERKWGAQEPLWWPAWIAQPR